jgi:signal transduction histidine kinase
MSTPRPRDGRAALDFLRRAPAGRAWLRYGAAIALTLLVVAGRRGLDPWWGHQHNRHLLFLPTVMVAAWIGGFGGGVVSTVLSTAALYLLWSDVPRQLPHPPTADLVLFFWLALALSALIASLQRARARADAARRSRERLLEIVAHDLRNPLTAIKTSSSTIRRAVPDLGQRLDRIDHAAQRMDDLIRDLVDSTRIEHGELVVTVRPEPVPPMIEETLELFSPLARERGITLLADPAPCPATVVCDRGRIMQVLSNLVGNALKFTPTGGRVTLAAAETDGTVRFEVADNGAGIAPADQPHVFEQYWKSDDKGTGLGLYIAQTIVEAHGSRISVRSTPGAGASFVFSLPR